MPTLNANDISKSISQVAKNIEYLKVLYEHQSRVRHTRDSMIDEKAVARLEEDIAQSKWNLVESLSNPQTFQTWLESDKNQAAMLYKYFAKGHFVAEIGADTTTLQRFQALESVFLAATPESLLTTEEQQRLKYAQANLVPEERRHQYLEEDARAVRVCLQDKIAQKAFDHAVAQFTQQSASDATIMKILKRIQDNPIFLQDHSAHNMVNPKGQEPTLSLDQVRELVSQNNVEKLKELDSVFDNLVAKKPLKNMIQQMRQYSKEISNDYTGLKI